MDDELFKDTMREFEKKNGRFLTSDEMCVRKKCRKRFEGAAKAERKNSGRAAGSHFPAGGEQTARRL
ncbi:MAG: hypothetical protein V8Q79_01650 [Christensenellales bacterium]